MATLKNPSVSAGPGTHWFTSKKVLLNNRLCAVPVAPGAKAPAHKSAGSPDPDQSERIIAEAERAGHGIAVLLFGPVIDVDVDSEDPHLNMALAHFLPFCGHVWGRESKPRSHFLYQIKNPVSSEEGPRHPESPLGLIHQRLRSRAVSRLAIEIRGGSAISRQHSVLPGSVHPSGEEYQWADPGAAASGLSVVSEAALATSIQWAALAALLAPLFVEGQRNEVSKALAGYLARRYRLASLAAEADGNSAAVAFGVLDRVQARAFLESVLELVGDDPADRTSRAQTFERTWNKVDADLDARVTGGIRLGEYATDAGLADTPAQYVQQLDIVLGAARNEAIIDLYTTRFCKHVGLGAVVDRDALGSEEPGRRFILSYEDHRRGHSGDFKFKNGEGKTIYLPRLLEFLNSAQIDHVDATTFEPKISRPIFAGPDGTRYLNLWRGFQLAPWEHPVTDADVGPFLRYIRENLANGDPASARWLINWLADLVRTPGRKVQTALVLLGAQGTGKSLLGAGIMRPIIGPVHYGFIESPDALTNNFNIELAGKVFVLADEVMNAGRQVIADKLKSLVTAETLNVERKNFDREVVPNYLRLVFTSNHERDAMPVEPSDRRYTFLGVNPRYARDDAYWGQFRQWLGSYTDTPGGRHLNGVRRIYRYLLDYEHDPMLSDRVLDTEAKRANALSSARPEDLWLLQWLHRGHPVDARLHEDNWWYALLADQDVRNPQTRREAWPQHVATEALRADLEAFYRARRATRGRRTDNLPTVAHVVRRLRDSGLDFAPGPRLEVSRPNRNSSIRDTRCRARYHRIPHPSRIRAYLLECGVPETELPAAAECDGWTDATSLDPAEGAEY